MHLKRVMMLAALALAVPGCKPTNGETAPAASTAAAAVHPVSGLKIIPLTITSAGKEIAFKVELAQSLQEQAKGLMFRTELGADEGMLFPFDPPKPASFWMRNTVIPLDLLFIAPDGRISNIAAQAKPYDETKLRSDGSVKAVLELRGGRAAELGIVPGDTVKW